jgi:putative transposase
VGRAGVSGALRALGGVSVDEVRGLTEEWIEGYNTERPHDSLGGLPPQAFMSRLHLAVESSSELSA